MQLNTDFLRFVLFIKFLSQLEALKKYCLFLSRTLFFSLTLDRVWPGLMHSLIPHFDTKQLEFHHTQLLALPLHTGLPTLYLNLAQSLVWTISAPADGSWAHPGLQFGFWFTSSPHVWGQFQQAHTHCVSFSKHRVMCWKLFFNNMWLPHLFPTPNTHKKPKTTNIGMCCWVILPFMSFTSALISLLQRKQQFETQGREGWGTCQQKGWELVWILQCEWGMRHPFFTLLSLILY